MSADESSFADFFGLFDAAALAFRGSLGRALPPQEVPFARRLVPGCARVVCDGTFVRDTCMDYIQSGAAQRKNDYLSELRFAEAAGPDDLSCLPGGVGFQGTGIAGLVPGGTFGGVGVTGWSCDVRTANGFIKYPV